MKLEAAHPEPGRKGAGMKFEPIVANPDLSIHDDPPGLWSRVAVVCRWKDAHAFRKQWPHAAVVGPLRTIRGIDELIRNLLLNPAVRVVILAGNDLTPGEETTQILCATFRGEAKVADDVQPYMERLRNEVFILTADGGPESTERALMDLLSTERYTGDRPDGRITLPPPTPTATAPAPHGDPGERVAADTLGELWPMVLHRAMRFGRIVPTQYGMTRELLNLVAVIRDPGKSLAELGGIADQKHPVLGITWTQAEAYHERVTGAAVPEGAAYSYGSRFRGVDRLETGEWVEVAPDQIEQINRLLSEDPGTRAAFATPWRPGKDNQ